jgi:hypothetical protein
MILLHGVGQLPVAGSCLEEWQCILGVRIRILISNFVCLFDGIATESTDKTFAHRQSAFQKLKDDNYPRA